MTRRMLPALLAGFLVSALWAATPAHAQAPVQYQPMNRFYYYPYYYFPHSYWPQQGPQWPEQPGQPYMRPPAYMAYPPFKEPNWRYEYLSPQTYYRGSHFWLDQF